MSIVSRTQVKSGEKHHRVHRTVNFSKILDYYLPITHEHALYPTPKWFDKTSAELSVIVPIHNNVEAFINTYERSELASFDAEFIFVDNNSTNNATHSLLNYFNETQQALGKIVMCLNQYSFYDCCKIGSNYTKSHNLLLLNPYTMIQNGISECIKMLRSDIMVSPCLVKETGKVFSAGRVWQNEFIDIGNNATLPVPMEYQKLTKDCITVQSVRPFACFIQRECFNKHKHISNSFDDMCLSLQVIAANEFVAIIDKECRFEDAVEADDVFFNKWVASNRLGEYQKIRGILINKHGSLQEVEKIMPLLRNTYPNAKFYSLNPSPIFDKSFSSVLECERLCQFIVNFDALHLDDFDTFKIYLGL